MIFQKSFNLIIMIFLLSFIFISQGWSKENKLAICFSEIMTTSSINPNEIQPITISDLVDKQKIYAALGALLGDLKKIAENNKEDFFQKSLELFSEQTSAFKVPAQNFYLEILSRINESLKNLNTQVSFSARFSVLPEKLCQKIYEDITKRKSYIDELRRKRLEVKLPQTIKYSTSEFNRNWRPEWEPQKKYKIEGMSFDISYKANLKKLEISGGLIYSAPRHFNYPLNIPLYLHNLPELILKSAFFEHSPKYPDRKHYIAMNVERVEFINGKMSFIHNSQANKTPEIHVYFSDEIFYELLFESQSLHLIPSFERPTAALLGDISLQKCEDKIKDSPRSYMALACEYLGRINLSLDHLVIDFIPTVIKEPHSSSQAPVLLPHIRAPNPNKGELGGVKLLPRHFKLAGSKQHRKELWISKFLYLNENSYIKPYFENALEIVNLRLKNNAIGALSVLNEIKKTVNAISSGELIKSSKEALNPTVGDYSVGDYSAKDYSLSGNSNRKNGNNENISYPSFRLPKRTHDISSGVDSHDQ